MQNLMGVGLREINLIEHNENDWFLFFWSGALGRIAQLVECSVCTLKALGSIID